MNFWGAKTESPALEESREVDDTSHIPDTTPESKAREDAVNIRNKLREELRHKPKPGQHFSYEKIFRPAARVLMEQAMGEGGEGLSLVSTNQTMNLSTTTKYVLNNRQTSAWEITLQSHGFSDFVSATYSTLNRYQLMYQRIFKTGAMGVAQWMVQPSPLAPGPVPPGNFFGLLEYPWRPHGCTALSYLKGQHLALSHTERPLRGLYLGSTLTYDLTTHDTTAAYALQSTSPDRRHTLAAEYKSNGDLRLALLHRHWPTDTEAVLEVDLARRKSGARTSGLTAGLRRNLLGGGVLNLVVSPLAKVRGMLELPFGQLERGGGPVKVAYNVSYDLPSSTVKHGVTIQM